MLKGVAKVGDGDLPEDRHGIVVALSNLSKILGASESDSAFSVVAETTATLLRVPRALVFTNQPGGDLTVVGSVGIADAPELVSAARAIARSGIAGSSPIILSNVAADSGAPARELSKGGVVSVICVPLRVGRENVGAIVAMSDALRAFSPSDVELLHVVAGQAALKAWRGKESEAESGVENQAELIRLAQRKIQELSLINQVSGAVSSTLDLEELLDIAVEQSMLAVGADTGSLMLVSEETNRLEIVAARGLARKLVEKTSQEVGASVAGWVAEHGESVLVTNAHADTRFRMPFFRDNITSAASVPLKSKDQVIGVLNVNTTRADRRFDERDLELLETVANELAVAIDNARLYARVNRRTKQLDSLLEISKTVTSTLNIEELMRRLAEEITKLFSLDVCTIILTDDVSGRLRLGHGIGLKTRRKYVYYDLASPLAAQVGRTGKKLILKDIRGSRHLSTDISAREGLRSAICLPLKNAGKVVAAAVGFTREARTFPKSQREIMRPLGELAGVAIRNARVYRQKYKMAEILTQRLTPSSIPKIDGLDIGHIFMPAHEVGGDYYDLLRVNKGKLGIVIGDVSGHDVESAEYISMGKHVLRAYAKEHPSPARVLGKTNDLICEDTRAEVFISLFYGVLDLEEMKLRYANAGCERPVLYRPADGTSTILDADGMLLGIRAGVRYEKREIDLRSGDVIALFTDGLTEAGVDKFRFGTDRIVTAIASSAHLGAQHIADSISDALFEFVHGRVTDDVALVVIKVG